MKILAIGNSFARNATRFLPEIAVSGGFELTVGLADLGGCSLEKHWNLVEQCDAIPEVKPYNFSINNEFTKAMNLREIIASDEWEYVTLQQVSHQSWRKETFEPYLGYLIKLINEIAPRAKVLLHQTWAYRYDATYFEENEIDQVKMYDGIGEAYSTHASEYGCKILPSGVGIQIARKSFNYKKDEVFDFENAEYPDLPDQTGSLISGYHWKTGNTSSGKAELHVDPIHCNDKGCYLGGAIWYEMISGKSIYDTSFLPEGITEQDIAILRKAAHDAVVQFGGPIN